MKENLIQQKTLEFSIKLAKFYMSLKDKKYYENKNITSVGRRRRAEWLHNSLEVELVYEQMSLKLNEL